MEWCDKVKLIQLGNIAKNTGDKTEFHGFILDHIGNFDNQAFEMLFQLIELIPQDMKKDIEFYKKLYPITCKIDMNKYDIISSMRLALLNTICEEEFNISE